MQALSDESTALEALLLYLRQSHGFDFTGYKRCHLIRQLQQRMQVVEVSNYSEYGSYLQEHPEEFASLFYTIENNFTGFFRDTESWSYIVSDIVPLIIASKQRSEPIRVWSAGCASGEEVYTLAIVFAQALGVEQFQKRILIYATDVDEEAINQARQGTYQSEQMVMVPPAVLSQYFERTGDAYVFRKELRRSIIFCRHNLLVDGPMSKIDLLVCRNVLIYFDIAAQTKVLVRFRFSLKDSGFLFLGNVEMVPRHINLFNAVSQRHRVYAKAHKVRVDRNLLSMAFLKRKRY